MRGAILISLTAVLCGLAGVSEAVTCTSATLSTCTKSEFVTGKCSDQVCSCTSSEYTPGPFGCQKKQKAVVTLDGFNGQIQTDASANLICSSGIGDNTYKWFKDGTEDATTSKTFEITTAAAGDSGSYTCQSNIAGILSEVSDPVTITVAATFTDKLEVSGMPTSAVVGTVITFQCETGPAYDSSTFAWEFDGSPVPSQTSATYQHTIESGNAGKGLKCTLPGAEDADTVAFPGTFDSNIAGVEITALTPTALPVGETLTLSCDSTGGFSDGDGRHLVYNWKKDSTDFSPEKTESSFTVATFAASDAGLYTCEATFESETTKVSSGVAVTVVSSIKKLGVESSSTNQLKNGYFTLSCDYETVSTLTPVTYKWFLGGVELLGVTDSILQFNEVGSDDLDGAYSCQVTNEDGTVTNAAINVVVAESSDEISAAPDLTVPATVGVGMKNTFSCAHSHVSSPGISYKWTVDSTLQDGEVLSTFDYTPDSTTAVSIGCKYVFDGQESDETTESVTPEYVFGVAITIEDSAVTALTPVATTTVKMMCSATTSSGAGTVTYAWMDGGTPIDGETSKYLELVAGAAGSGAKTITCSATANSEVKTSTGVTFTPQATAEKPVVEFATVTGNYLRDQRITMTCKSTSHAEGAKFEWSKDGTIISGATSSTYKIKKLAETDDGDFTCKIIVGEQTSDASDAETLTTLANELSCTFASKCVDPDNPFLDGTACVDSKCQCQSGYTLEGGICSGAAAMMGSLLMLVCVVLTHGMF